MAFKRPGVWEQWLHRDSPLVTPRAQRSQQLTLSSGRNVPPQKAEAAAATTKKGIKHNWGPNSVLTDMKNEEEAVLSKILGGESILR